LKIKVDCLGARLYLRSNINMKSTTCGKLSVAPRKKVSKRNKTPNGEGVDHGDGDHVKSEGNDWDIPKKIIPAPDKLNLTEEELETVIERILEAKNPNAPDNIVRFNYNKDEMTYKHDHTVEQTCFHYSDDGSLILKNGEEARLQREEQEKKRVALMARMQEEAQAQSDTPNPSTGVGDAEIDPKQVYNQFNFSERATQTFNNPTRDQVSVSEPPPSMEFCTTATQWEIYDSYQQYFEEQKKSTKSNKKSGFEKEEKKKERQKTAQEIIHSESMARSTQLMERMINQNSHDEILEDFKFWNDPSDDFKDPPSGSVLPLWKFSSEKIGKKQVTALCWNPQYRDLFAVGYGSYDFMKQGGGVICCFSLKNPSYPEFFFTTETGVMCLDFHPKHSSLLAVGLYDGTVMIFDVRQKQNKPLILSTVKTGKHSDVVWQVSWQQEAITQALSFFSVSSDGRVTNWTLSKNELQCTDVMLLKIEAPLSSGEDHQNGDAAKQSNDDYLVGLAGGTCFDFNKKSDHLFIVGTEEGKIHACSKAYNSQYLQTYEGHNMSVYAVKWNYFHPNVFLSASADWTVKLWDQNYKTPLCTFELGSSVGDVAWSPYSSTTFAAVTDNGKVHIFDLDINKHDSLCHQFVVKKMKLTHLAFNPVEPIIIVGDDKGGVQALKLSPNLRKVSKAENSGHGTTHVSTATTTLGSGTTNLKPDPQAEFQKLERFLDTATKSL
jgi:dynein intermediate chain 1